MVKMLKYLVQCNDFGARHAGSNPQCQCYVEVRRHKTIKRINSHVLLSSKLIKQ